MSNLPWQNKPIRSLLTLAWPIAVSMLSFSAMSIVDTAFVGQISPAALAGVGLSSLLTFTLACFGIGMLRAVKTLVSQRVGAGNTDVLAILGAGFVFAGVFGAISLALGAAVYCALPGLAGDVGMGEAAQSYFAVRLWSLPMLFAYVALREFAYGQAQSRAPMLASLCANLCNGLLDCLFLFVFQWGVAGVAAATVIAQLVELGVLWFALSPKVSALRPRRRHLRELWRIGLPTGLQFLIEVGSFTLSGLIIASLSKIEMAAHQLAIHVLHLSFLPAHAIAEAGAVLTGQAVGAGRMGLVGVVAKKTAVTASIYTGTFALILALTAPMVAGLLSNDLRVAEGAAVLLVFSVCIQLVDGAAIVAGAVVRAVGDVRFAAIASIAVAWLCTPTSAYFLGVRGGLGALGAWIGIAFEIALITLVLWWRLLSGRWKVAAERCVQLARDGDET